MRGLLVSLAVYTCLFMSLNSVNAQVDEHKMEVGAVFTSVTLTNFKDRLFSPSLGSGNSTVKGVGARFAYNLTDHLAIDAEGNFFPEAHFGNDELGQKMQGFAGLKAGGRHKWVGVFAKARPGVMWFGEFPSRGSCSATSFGRACSVSHEKDFALDLGAVVEFYPSKRVIVRADVGDTIVWYPERFRQTLAPPPTRIDAEVKNNFQLSIGVGWRF